MNTMELHTSRSNTNRSPPMSTFENIELISNIFSQVESQEEEVGNMNAFSFQKSSEIFKESEEKELNELPILGSMPEEKDNKNIFKNFDDSNIKKDEPVNTKDAKENLPKSKTKIKHKKYKISKKEKINLKSQNRSKKLKKTPLKILQNRNFNQTSSKRKHQSNLEKSKQIKTSQNQKMSEIFMNVIKI